MLSKNQQWRQKQKVKGLCIHCTQPAEPGYVSCLGHMTQYRDYIRNLRKEKAFLKICSWCPEPAIKGTARCLKHTYYQRDAQYKLREKRKKERKCTGCGCHLEELEKTKCVNCYEENRKSLTVAIKIPIRRGRLRCKEL